MSTVRTKDILWTRSFTLTIVGILFLFIPFALYMPVLPIYLLKELNASLQAAGAVNGAFLIAAVLFRAQTSHLERRFGVRRILMVSGFLFMATNALYLWTTNVSCILGIRFISGAFFAVVNTSIYAMGSQLIPVSRKGEGLAVMTTMFLAGGAIGPYLGLSLARSLGYQAVFIFCFLISLLGMLIFCIMKIPAERLQTHGQFSFRHLYEKKAIPVSLIVLMLAVAYGGVLTFVTIYAAKLQLRLVVDYFFVVMTVASVAARLVTGRLYDRRGPDAAIYPAILLMATGLLILGSSLSTAGMLLAAALIGAGYGMAVPGIQTLAIQLSPAHRTSEVTATFFTCLDGGIGLSSYLLGGTILAFGYATVYLSLGLLTLVCTLFYYYVRHKALVLKSC